MALRLLDRKAKVFANHAPLSVHLLVGIDQDETGQAVSGGMTATCGPAPARRGT